jgi:phosphopantothenoylcysteine decarboxylase/phosphopantothenate--cysteine ligase
MGYAIAEAARDRGASVTLVSAATGLPDPVGVKVLNVNTTIEMRDALVRRASSSIDALIMAAAVSDYRPAETLPQKLKKTAEVLTVKLVRNPDILEEVRGNFIRVGFAAESENTVDNAKLKLVQKDLDLIVANDVTLPGSGFASDTNKVVIIGRNGNVEELPLMSKYDVAQRILDRVVELLRNRRG